MPPLTCLNTLRARHAALCAQPPSLNMTRGLPSAEQVALSRPFLSLPGEQAFCAADGQDWLNYGGLQGLREVRDLFGPLLLGLPGEQVAVGENSSLALMHETLGHAWVRGFPASPAWGRADRVRFICPEPGYDRHFSICEYYGIDMVPVAMTEHGPDMNEVERLVASDPTIKGMWCVPRHANPNGAVYTSQVVTRLAAMPAAARDFRLFWDNAYAMHDFAGPSPADDNSAIHTACAQAGHPDRVLAFASTSKMLIPGAGLAFFGASQAMLRWWLECRTHKTIGPDKVNQVRHLLFFKDPDTVRRHMQQQGHLLQEKFAQVERIFDQHLSGIEQVSWSSPGGGYFIALQVPHGRAAQVVELAGQAGVSMTPAGATHCHGIDRQGRHLRIAPSYLSLEQVVTAARIIAHAVQLACAAPAAEH